MAASAAAVGAATASDVAGPGCQEHQEWPHSHGQRTMVNETISLVLFASLVMGMALQYLVHWKDPDIRGSTYKMISTTITIFCAIWITEAIFSFFLRFLVQRVFHYDAEDVRVTFSVGLMIFLSFVLLISGCCLRLRRTRLRLHGAKSLLGHLCAFSGIRAFSPLLEERTTDWEIISVLGCTFCAEAGLVAFTNWARANFLMSSSYGDLRQEGNRGEEEVLLWQEEARDAENEALVLMSSYLFNQYVAFRLTGRVPAMDVIEREAQDSAPGMEGMALWFLGFVALLLIFTYVNFTCQAEGIATRLLTNMQDFLAASSCWCALRFGCWWSLQTRENRMAVAYVVNALAISVLAILAMILIDVVADRITHGHKQSGAVEDARQESGLASPWSEESASGSECGSTVSASQDNPSMSALEDNPSMSALHRKVRTQLRSRRNHEKVLRTLIEALGVLVGLAWEGALDMSTATIVTNFRAFRIHPVLMNVFVAAALGSFALPAWLRFVLPMSMLRREEHQRRINIEIEQADPEAEEINVPCSCLMPGTG